MLPSTFTLFFLLFFLSWRSPFHFYPVNFHSSFMMHNMGCLLQAAFLILPTSFNFTFPRTLLSFCSTIGASHLLLVSLPFVYKSSYLTPRANTKSHSSLQLQLSTVVAHYDSHHWPHLLPEPRWSADKNGSHSHFLHSTNIYVVSGFLVTVYYRNE